MKFLLENYKKLVFVLVVLVLIIFIGVSSSSYDMNAAENGTGNVVSKIQGVFFNIGKTFSNASYSIRNVSKLNERNEYLENNLYELMDENRKLKQIVNRSDILKAEYELQKNIEYDYEKCQIISKDDSSWFTRFTINKGSTDGLKKNDIVIKAVQTEDGIVQIGLLGIVTQIGDNWSKVITITDEECKVTYKDIENDQAGIMSGSIDQKISGFFLNNKVVASVGDEIFTSGIGNIYIKDIYIGKISKIEDTTDASTSKIFIEPVVDFSNIYDVYVLKVER